jgi:hypothetical protein
VWIEDKMLSVVIVVSIVQGAVATFIIILRLATRLKTRAGGFEDVLAASSLLPLYALYILQSLSTRHHASLPVSHTKLTALQCLQWAAWGSQCRNWTCMSNTAFPAYFYRS